ncbi:DUF3014 domain-containing protein [Colwellia sp. 12G3]|uniref:DUF3014 domain-containing protein n=1 Tax=Colwellia sp. 12G3 TaxID=2058299 RepID=UPI000C3283CE|nr:DUF3014 domain-containing protein [Colwellia sp. 12G3]PKI17108.1 DUF3014 domain-containing protein [Colwellia sp. 12G3]
MDNSESTPQIEQGKSDRNSGPMIIFIVTFILVVVAIWQFSGGKTEKRPMDSGELLKQEPIVSVSPPAQKLEEDKGLIELPPIPPITENVTPRVQETIIEQEITIILPALDKSDDWIQEKLPELTWRNELLSLLITEDIIRRFVVFTDNFTQGLLAYDHSLFIQPKVKFSVDEQLSNVDGEQNVWQWDSETSKRFDLYVDLLRSVDSTTLVNLYVDIKPLIDEAYLELGYEEDFTYTLQDAITRVLDMELPKSAMDVTRTSVMYKYQDPQLEALDDSDKLMLRIGKENLLIIKSVLLEVNEKLTKRVNDNG